MTALVIPISVQRLTCESCGAEAVASCNCGVEYRPKSVRAGEAVKANPEKSNRAIAADIGVDEKTVRQARSTADRSAVEARTGLDGKTRKIPEKKSGSPKEDDDEPETDTDGDYDEGSWPEEARKALRRERREHFETLKRAMSAEERCNKLVVALNAKEVTEGRDWPLDKMTKKHVKKRDEALEAIAHRQKSLAKLYAEVTGQPSWRVEIIDNEGKQFANGLRFALCGEADGYAKKQERSGITAEIVCDGEEANVEVNGEKIRFRHGDCVLFNWRPIAGGNE